MHRRTVRVGLALVWRVWSGQGGVGRWKSRPRTVPFTNEAGRRRPRRAPPRLQARQDPGPPSRVSEPGGRAQAAQAAQAGKVWSSLAAWSAEPRGAVAGRPLVRLGSQIRPRLRCSTGGTWRPLRRAELSALSLGCNDSIDLPSGPNAVRRRRVIFQSPSLAPRGCRHCTGAALFARLPPHRNAAAAAVAAPTRRRVRSPPPRTTCDLSRQSG